jgi:phosphatidylserine decarboxylase
MNEPAPDFSNSAYLFPRINREGIKFGCIALVIAILVAVAAGRFCFLGWLTLPMFLLAYGVFLFFRDPDRYPPEDEKAILSPADGRICLIQECELPDAFGEMDEYRGRKHWRVSVFMSVFNVHVNRLPTAGEIVKKQYVAAGKFLNASLDKASKENERCNYLVKAENGQVYGVTQIAGLVARRIVPQVEEGQKLSRADRFGLIRFGSRLDVYLPEGVKPEVRVGQTMVSGETVLGHLS